MKCYLIITIVLAYAANCSGQVGIIDADTNDVYNENEFIGTGKILPDTPEGIASFCESYMSQANRDRIVYTLSVWLKFVGSLKPDLIAIHDTVFNDPTNVIPNAVDWFCKLNVTMAVSVAKGYNSKLVIGHLIKEAAINNILVASKQNSHTLPLIICALREYTEQIQLAHNDSPDLRHFAYSLVRYSTVFADLVDPKHCVRTEDNRCDLSKDNICDPEFSYKSVMHVAFAGLNKYF